MPLTKHERKEKLGHGGLSRIAKRRKVTVGHVSQVNAELRRDPKVERDIATAIHQKHGIPIEEVFSHQSAA